MYSALVLYVISTFFIAQKTEEGIEQTTNSDSICCAHTSSIHSPCLRLVYSSVAAQETNTRSESESSRRRQQGTAAGRRSAAAVVVDVCGS